MAGVAEELGEGRGLLVGGVVVGLRGGAIGIGGFGHAVVGVVGVAGGERLRLSVDRAGDGLAQLVVVGVVGVGGDVAEGVGLLREVAGGVVVVIRWIAGGVGDGRGQAGLVVDGCGGFAVGVG